MPAPLDDAAAARWRRTSPAAALHFLAVALKQLAQQAFNLALGASAAILLLAQSMPFARLAWIGALAVAGCIALAAGAALLRYWNFRFQLGAERIRIRQGVLRKSQTDIQFDRIQGIDIQRSPLFRLLGLATVRFGTAGAAGDEGVLPAVADSFAESLRRRIDCRDAASLPLPAGGAGQPRSRPAPQALLRLGIGDMARIGLTDPAPTLVLLAGLATTGSSLIRAYGDALRPSALETRDAYAAVFAPLGEAAAVAAAVGALALGAAALLFALSFAVALLRFGGFELLLDGTALRTRCGLLTRKEVTVERSKIQQLRFSQGLLLRWLGRCRLHALPVGSGPPSAHAGAAQARMLRVPIAPLAAAEEFGAHAFADEGEGLSLLPRAHPFQPVSRHYIRARTLQMGVLPAALATLALAPLAGAASLLCLAWIAVAALLSWQRWRRLGYWHDGRGLVKRTGLFGHRIDVFLLRKVQSVSVTQSPLQRRKSLGRLSMRLASGEVEVPYMDYDAACRLRDYILYKAESSDAPWH